MRRKGEKKRESNRTNTHCNKWEFLYTNTHTHHRQFNRTSNIFKQQQQKWMENMCLGQTIEKRAQCKKRKKQKLAMWSFQCQKLLFLWYVIFYIVCAYFPVPHWASVKWVSIEWWWSRRVYSCTDNRIVFRYVQCSCYWFREFFFSSVTEPDAYPSIPKQCRCFYTLYRK